MNETIKKMFKKDIEAPLIKGQYTLVHNGMDIRFLNSNKDVINAVIECVEYNIKLNPEKIFDRTIKVGTEQGVDKWVRIIRIKYYTLYEEDFFIEF